MAELHGEALDRAVAGVLGWTREDGYWCEPEGWRHTGPPRYSSDWSRLPEMLAWLRERGWFVNISSGPKGWGAGALYRPGGVSWPLDRSELQIDEDLPPCIARLVVAVAEAKG